MVEGVRRNLRAFVGTTAFEELARQWVWMRGKTGQLAFLAQEVGSYWSRRVQVNIVALNWTTHEILLGECKWGMDRVDLQVVRELIEKKAPLVLRDLPEADRGWKIHYALFARSGFTSAASAEMQRSHGLLINLNTLEADLSQLDQQH